MKNQVEKILNKACEIQKCFSNSSQSDDEMKNKIKEASGFDIDENIDSNQSRISWDSYFMSLAFLVSMRSPDAQTKHGCVIVDENNRIISTGYNGFLPYALDNRMPNIRPKKYNHIVHSEINAIISAKQDISKCKMYVTGLPCNECLKSIAASGIKKIIVGDKPHVFAEDHLEIISFTCTSQGIEIVKFSGKIAHLEGRDI
jgi:dCMP deaminase